MTLRRRVGMVAAASVGVALVLAAIVCYFVVRGELLRQVDNSLRAQAGAIQRDVYSLDRPLPGISPSAGGPAPYVQILLPDGSTPAREGGLTLPVSAAARAVAAGGLSSYMADIHAGGSHLREFVFRIPAQYNGQPVAVQLARPLNGIDHVLTNLRLVLLGLCLGGIALAGGLGRLAARRVLAPLADVADTAQHISETEDLAARIQVRADDEVGQLATRFNAMLERLQSSRVALDESVLAQRQLVADASHELRTPVTSLRTNIEVLLAHEQLDRDERQRMLTDVVEQTEELSALVGDLIDLARGDLPSDSVDELALHRVVSESVERARRNFPGIEFEPRLEEVFVRGSAERLSRAVNNLLDNAARHSPPSGPVEVTLEESGELRVRDHGPGVSEEDLPHIFDRFYRGASARGEQGSGLGLAIVRQVAEQHGGSVNVANAPDRGAIFTLRLPALAPDDPAGDPAGRGSGSGRPDDPRLAGASEALSQ